MRVLHDVHANGIGRFMEWAFGTMAETLVRMPASHIDSADLSTDIPKVGAA